MCYYCNNVVTRTLAVVFNKLRAKKYQHVKEPIGC